MLWLGAEIAIIATDIAEVIGTAIGLNLIFQVPLEIGVIITALDVFLILYLQKLGFRWVEALIITLLGVIAVCFGVQIALADPNWGEVIRGFAPTTEIVTNPQMLYLALGILGATVMPHNLYLHSSIIQTRKYADNAESKREAVRFATIDSTVALMFALFLNGAILIVAAATFHTSGHEQVAEISDAYMLLAPLLGTQLASTLFAVALLFSGQNATLTGTLAGQIVMEGFLNIRLRPWLRRLITRLIAIIPALITVYFYGEHGIGQLIVLSQVILSLQLSFAVFPLVMFTGDKRKMGPLVAPPWMMALAWPIAVLIAGLNAWLLWQTFFS
jgi:manganese transport protein